MIKKILRQSKLKKMLKKLVIENNIHRKNYRTIEKILKSDFSNDVKVGALTYLITQLNEHIDLLDD